MNMLPILYVEDEESDVLLLQHAFTKAGIPNPLHTAPDGKVAVDYLAGNPPFDDRTRHPLPGLILLDLNLPFRSGLEVLAWLRKQPQLRHLPVLVFSSSNRPDDIVRAYETGANGYLVKPSSLAQLVAQVSALRDFWLTQNCQP